MREHLACRHRNKPGSLRKTLMLRDETPKLHRSHGVERKKAEQEAMSSPGEATYYSCCIKYALTDCTHVEANHRER